MTSSLDFEDEENLREVLTSWYGPTAQNWNINDKLINTIIGMVKDMLDCSHTMSYVPQPISFGNPLSQLARIELKGFINRLRDDSRIYVICKKTVLYKNRTTLMEDAGY